MCSQHEDPHRLNARHVCSPKWVSTWSIHDIYDNQICYDPIGSGGSGPTRPTPIRYSPARSESVRSGYERTGSAPTAIHNMTTYMDGMIHGSWIMTHTPWPVDYWASAHGACRMYHTSWQMARGTVYMGHEPWAMDHVACDADYCHWTMNHDI